MRIGWLKKGRRGEGGDGDAGSSHLHVFDVYLREASADRGRKVLDKNKGMGEGVSRRGENKKSDQQR